MLIVSSHFPSHPEAHTHTYTQSYIIAYLTQIWPLLAIPMHACLTWFLLFVFFSLFFLCLSLQRFRSLEQNLSAINVLFEELAEGMGVARLDMIRHSMMSSGPNAFTPKEVMRSISKLFAYSSPF